MTIKTLKFGGCSKSVAKREVYSITGLSKNQVDSQIKKKSNTLPKKKKEHIKTKVRRRKKIIKDQSRIK